MNTRAPMDGLIDRETNLLELSHRYRFSCDALKHLAAVYGSELEKVLAVLRTPGKSFYFRVNTLKTAKDEVESIFESKGLKVQAHPSVEEALSLPLDGPFDVPEFGRRVVVDKFTAESVLQGAQVYAPGVVVCRKLRRNEGVTVVDEKGEILAAGLARMSETEVLTRRKGLVVEVTSPKYRVPSLRETEEFRIGLIYPQSLPAMITSKVLDPKSDETVVDLTCAPGGKLSHISQLMGNRGKVIGVDRNRPKIEAAMETAKRLGCRNVTLFAHDSRYLHLDLPEIRADRVLVDPPCSALGIMPKLYEYATREEIEALANYQGQFLRAASHIVKLGGVVVYSVCTVTVEECEKIVSFAQEECGLTSRAQRILLGDKGLAHIVSGAELTQRFHPHLHDSEYFIACFHTQD